MVSEFPRPSANSQEVKGLLSRLSQLSQATETFFRQIYQSVAQRSELETSQQITRHLYKQQQQLQAILQRREQEVAYLNSIISSIHEGIILQDMEGQFILINEAAKTMLGNKRNLRRSGIHQLLESYHDVKVPEGKLVPLGDPIELEVNQQVLRVTMAAVSDHQRNRVGTLLVLRNITLEAVGQRLKDQFVAGISHELRTPMNVLRLSSEVLSVSVPKEFKNYKLLETIGRNVDVLDRMINELLDVSEMASGDFQARQELVEIESLVWSVVNGAMPEAKKDDLTISVMARNPNKLRITGDPQRLRWALGHLLQNSIRYTESGGRIILTMSLNKNQQVAIQVIDTGVGISEEDIDNIFDRFYRGTPRTTSGKLIDPRGLGQGLFIALATAHAHGGDVTVQSNPGQGSAFTMFLPTTN